MPFEKNVVAMVYDFDGTLSPEAMQSYGVLPSLSVKPDEFWANVKAKRSERKSEELLVYMQEMIKLAESNGVRLDKTSFQQH